VKISVSAMVNIWTIRHSRIYVNGVYQAAFSGGSPILYESTASCELFVSSGMQEGLQSPMWGLVLYRSWLLGHREHRKWYSLESVTAHIDSSCS
jgi:hypothetical protein